MWEAERFAEGLRISQIEGTRWPTKPEITEIIQHKDSEQLWFEDGSSLIIHENNSYDVVESI